MPANGAARHSRLEMAQAVRRACMRRCGRDAAPVCVRKLETARACAVANI